MTVISLSDHMMNTGAIRLPGWHFEDKPYTETLKVVLVTVQVANTPTFTLVREYSGRRVQVE